MDISLREWLIIGGVLIVILILVDGWRRVSANRSRLKLEIDRTLSELGEGEPQQHNPELPNGGARVRADEQAAEAASRSTGSKRKRIEPSLGPAEDESDSGLTEMDPLFDDIPAREGGSARLHGRKRDSASATEGKPARVKASEEKVRLRVVEPGETRNFGLREEAPVREQELRQVEAAAGRRDNAQVATDTEQPIPTLFDQLGQEQQPEETQADSREPRAQESRSAAAETAVAEAKSEASERRISDSETYVETVELSAQELFELSEKATVTKIQAVVDEQDAEPEAEAVRPEPAPAKAKAKPQGPSLSAPLDPEHVLVITVVARNGERLPGLALDRIVTACGMDWGDMSLYHRAEDSEPGAPVQFSMANAVAPGTFDPDKLEELETPAVSFFMSMNEPRDPMTAYECMLATAETLAKHLNGDLLDEDRSVMRPQTKEHYRERIREFQMHQRQRRAN